MFFSALFLLNKMKEQAAEKTRAHKRWECCVEKQQ